MGRVVVVLPLKDGAHREALGLLREGPPVDVNRLHQYQAFLSSREAVIVLEGPGVGPEDGRPWDDLTAWRDGPRWTRCAASAPRIAGGAHSWERSQDHQGVFFGPQPGPGDSEGGHAVVSGGSHPRQP